MSRIAVGRLPDGALQLFVVIGARMFTFWKESTEGGASWQFAPMLDGISGCAAVGSLPDRRMQLFFIEPHALPPSSGLPRYEIRLMTMWKESTGPGAPWTRPQPFVPAFPDVPKNIGVGRLSNGTLQLFVLTDSGREFTTSKASADSDAPWTAWSSEPDVQGRDNSADIAVGTLPDGSLQEFQAIGQQLITRWKATNEVAAPWTTWEEMVGPNSGLSPTRIGVGLLSDRRMQLFINSHGQLFTVRKESTASGAPWTTLFPFDPAPVHGVSDMAAGRLPDRSTQLFALSDSLDKIELITTWKESVDSDSKWVPWSTMHSWTR